MRTLEAVVLQHLQLSSLAIVANATVMSDLTKLMTAFRKPWCLIGGFAVVAHGHNRTTDDIDLLLACSREDFAKFRLMANWYGFRAPESHTGTIQRMTHKATHTEVEVLWADTPKQVAAAHNSQQTSVLGYRVPVISLVDLMVQKIDVAEANPGRRNKDWNDVSGLLGVVEDNWFETVVTLVKEQVSDRSGTILDGFANTIRNMRA